MKLGIISDTHDFFDDRIPKLFSGVAHILHAGDIGRPSILHRLEEIAAVTAVQGNTDDAGFAYPSFAEVEVADTRFLIHHIVNPDAISEALQRKIDQVRPAFVIFGHTHRPLARTVNGVRFFNPGYAGRTRFGMERTLAVLTRQGNTWCEEFFSLD
jgi:putative phosphoesterase